MVGVTIMDCPFSCYKGKVQMLMDTGKKKVYQCARCKQIWEEKKSVPGVSE